MWCVLKTKICFEKRVASARIQLVCLPGCHTNKQTNKQANKNIFFWVFKKTLNPITTLAR
jgi:hypothetical protein